MQTNALFLALAAGLISAVVFASATTGPVLLRFVLFFLTPFALYLAGLGLGHAAAAIAAIFATAIILLLTTPLTACVYALSTAAPAYVTSRLALLSRDEGDAREWYPLGRIIAIAALFGGSLAALIILLMGADVAALTKAMRGLVETFVKTELPNLPNAPEMKEEQITEMTATALRSLPWALGSLSTVTILLNLWLAARVTLASGRLTRPWPDLTAVQLPTGAMIALVAATAATLAGGLPALLAGGFAGAFTLAFALIGLAVAHVFSRGSPWRNFILSALYASLIVFLGPVALILAILGLAETVFGYRFARERQPPPKP